MGTKGGDAALETIALLETRLQRLEFYTTGSDGSQRSTDELSSQEKQENIPSRLQRIETGLQQLAAQSQVVRDILRLYSSHPEIFPPVTPADDHASFSSAEQLAIIDSCATLFPTTASRLTSIQDVPIPSAESSAGLISLHPRLAKVELLQQSHLNEMADLRLRTAAVLQRWYELGVLGQGECWSEWEGRVMEAEKAARREEAARSRESGTI